MQHLRDGRAKAGESLPLLVDSRLCLTLLGVQLRNKNALVRPRSRRPKSSRSFHVSASEYIPGDLNKPKICRCAGPRRWRLAGVALPLEPVSCVWGNEKGEYPSGAKRVKITQSVHGWLEACKNIVELLNDSIRTSEETTEA